MAAPLVRTITATLFALPLACGTPADHEAAIMNPDNPDQLESDPDTYQLNSVMGGVTAAGEPLSTATVTVVQTGEAHAVSEAGRYLIVLDAAKLGTRRHELRFSAPGYRDRTELVFVPENNQTRLNVELEPEG